MLADTVASVDFSQWPFIIKTTQERTLRAMAVIIATGASPSRLEIPGESEYFGRGVNTCAICDARFCVGEDVVVVGGGDSAAEEAMQLANHAKSVTILARKDRMRASAHMQMRLAEFPTISIKYNVDVKKVLGDEKVTGVELYNNKTQTTEIFPTTRLFLAIGHTPNSEVFKDAVAVNEAGFIKTLGHTKKTTVPGVFAAGEVEDYRYRQAATSAGDGVKAALDALSFLRDLGFNPSVAAKLRDEGKIWQFADGYEITDLESYELFQEMMQKSEDVCVMLDFYTQECPSCTRILPMLTHLAKQMRGTMKIFKVDADRPDMDQLVKKYVAQGVPCLLVFRAGKLIARYSPTPTTTREELQTFARQCQAE
jgi:thioredoxin reductase (NADPH)